ncbi:glycogen/starch/alpha-glucan phosphorylase [Geodermatophilus normandii]|uniref:Glycogen/starch/alpha-glucan phosphorylase n=1 Tax=Geodermatophilus normandii TaxID=1137989 RepID=A0A6P0GFP1_9ACTN|nr:glycogen/starch/alpha-glucan phosphorylase [Geodermatophilus normandii]
MLTVFYWAPEVCLLGFDHQREVTIRSERPGGVVDTASVDVLDEHGSTDFRLEWDDPLTALGTYRIQARQDDLAASLDVRVVSADNPTRVVDYWRNQGFLFSGFRPGEQVRVDLYGGVKDGNDSGESSLAWVGNDVVTLDGNGQGRYSVPRAERFPCWGLLVEGLRDSYTPEAWCPASLD